MACSLNSERLYRRNRRDLNSKLILLVGPSRSGKTQLLQPKLGDKLSIEPLNVGLELA